MIQPEPVAIGQEPAVIGQEHDVEAPLMVTRGRLRFELAGPEADAELRGMLARNPMPGSVRLALERNPSFFLGAGVEGDSHQTVIARETDSGLAIGMCSRAGRMAFVNGEARRLGYLSQLRVEEAWRARRGPVQGGFALCKLLHDRDDVPLYVTTIASENHTARKLLEAGLPGLPTYRRREPLETFVIPLGRRRPLMRGDLELRPGRPSDWPEIAGFLTRQYARYQFAPHWSVETLTHPERCRELAAEDFTLAFRRGMLLGCVSVWNQMGFKQTVIHGYGRTLARLRPVANAVAPVLGWPRLPGVGEPLPHAYLAHLAIADDCPRIGRTLLVAASNRAVERGFACLTLGLASRHPLVGMITRTFLPIRYRCMLYVVHWQDGEAVADALDDRLSHLEVAVL